MNNSRKSLKESLGMEEDLEFDSNYDDTNYDDDFGQVLSDNEEGEDMIIMEEPIVQKPSPWIFLDTKKFVKQILAKVASDMTDNGIGLEDDIDQHDDIFKSEYAWKCLNIFRVIGYNSSKIETILDNREKYLKLAGVLEEPKPETKKKEIECSVCLNDVPWQESMCLDCKHRFCKPCWKDSVENTVKNNSFELLFERLICMQRDCTLTILGCNIYELVSEQTFLHYLNMLTKAYIQENKATYSICPTTKCGLIAQPSKKNEKPTNIVVCECGTAYCFKCNLSAHAPASCSEMNKWLLKNTDDQASINLIKATATICPKCKEAMDRTTACNHITCKCGHQFCFQCLAAWGKCSYYKCANFKSKEEAEDHAFKTQGGEFSKGYKTPTEWLLAHERFVAFGNKSMFYKNIAEKLEASTQSIKEKCLNYRELVIGGNPQFIEEGYTILTKCYRILQYLIVWGFFNIPEGQCPQKQIFEMQIANFEERCRLLKELLEKPIAEMNQIKTLDISRALEKNLIQEVESTDDLLSLFSQAVTGTQEFVSTQKRWTCPEKSCEGYSNEASSKKCAHCGKDRPEVKLLWFGEETKK
jgi:ariadne-1